MHEHTSHTEQTRSSCLTCWLNAKEEEEPPLTAKSKLTSCLEQFRSRMALRLPFQCSSWKTVMSSWNSSIERPLLASSMNLNAPIPVLGSSMSAELPWQFTYDEVTKKYKQSDQTYHKHTGFITYYCTITTTTTYSGDAEVTGRFTEVFKTDKYHLKWWFWQFKFEGWISSPSTMNTEHACPSLQKIDTL